MGDGYLDYAVTDWWWADRKLDRPRNLDEYWRTDPAIRKEWEDFVERTTAGEDSDIAHAQPADFVNPEHYRTNGIECIEYQRATSTPEEFQGYLKNCCVKYLHRMRTKDDPLKNLLKAQWYLNRLVEEFKKQ